MGLPSIRRHGLIGTVILLLSFAAAAAQQPPAMLGAADGAAIRRAITDQMAAFGRNDGAAAFGYASPTIREMFRTPEIFMAMVKSGYQPVYRPRHVEFGIIDTEDGQPTQHVLVTGPDGTVVEALYFMEHEKDGRWLINGCVLKPSYQA